jgi:hypothetical protein
MVSVAGNVSLMANRVRIAEAINGYLDYDISIGSIYYVFPNRIIIAPLRIKKKTLAADPSSLILSGVAVRFSVWDLITSGKRTVPDVTVYASQVRYDVFCQFLEDNYERLLEIIRNSSGEDIKIRLHETLLNFDRPGELDQIAMEFYLSLRGESMEGTGLFRVGRYGPLKQGGKEAQRMIKGWPLWYKIHGTLKPDGFRIDQLIFTSGNLYSKWWGSLQNGLFKVNGFTFMDTTKQNPDEMGYSFSRYIHHFPTDNELSYIDTYILDIDGTIRLTYPVIEIEKIDFNLNDIPMSMQGSISLLSPLTIDAALSLRKSASKGGWRDYIDEAQLKFHGTWKENVLTTNGHMDINFKNMGRSSLAPDRAKFTFNDLHLFVDPIRRTVLDLSSGDIVYFTNDNAHKISIQAFKAVTTKEMEGHKTTEILGPFYGGGMNGRVWFDATQIPTKITALILLHDVDTDALEELMIHFAKFNGRMSSTMSFTNVPEMDLSGDITINEGKLTDFDFFNWVADSFNLPVLRATEFERGSAQFTINKDRILLHDIRLRTEDVHIGGYYEIDSQSLVTSELSLKLSRALLNKSPKFSLLLKTYKREDSHLNFDFRLSGNIDAMNFQWLPSEVKRQIQSQIPDFIERRIEQDVDEMMDPGPKDVK